MVILKGSSKMAKRPVFYPIINPPYVKEIELQFEWFSGFAISQVQKSIHSLHLAAEKAGISPVLEISSKSSLSLGVELSAFNLMLSLNDGKMISVECAFQGSKVFERSGPYTNLYYETSRETKKYPRLHESGNVIGFNLFGEEFPINPPTAFYDWIYLNALSQNTHLADQLFAYRGFSDIKFNPQKSINCQARSAALYVALSTNGQLDKVLSNREYYFSIINNGKKQSLSAREVMLPFNDITWNNNESDNA